MANIIVELLYKKRESFTQHLIKQVLLLSTLLLLFSCRKNNPVERKPDSMKTALQTHVWVQDSFVYKNVDLDTYVFYEPKEFIRFGSDKYYTNRGTDSLNYELEEPDFLYYRNDGGKKTVGQFYYIDTVTDKILVLRNVATYNTYVYYHGE